MDEDEFRFAESSLIDGVEEEGFTFEEVCGDENHIRADRITSGLTQPPISFRFITHLTSLGSVVAPE
jgi:hypothetical protein